LILSIAALDGEMAKTKNSLEVLNAQEKFLDSIQAATSNKASEEVAQGKADVLNWEKVYDFLGTKLAAVLVPVVVVFWEPKSGLTLVPAMAAAAPATSASAVSRARRQMAGRTAMCSMMAQSRRCRAPTRRGPLPC
jgi:hypothetical protein